MAAWPRPDVPLSRWRIAAVLAGNVLSVTFAFMLNDPAPAVSWSVVDWRRRPKMAYEALRVAMSPVLICAEYPMERYLRAAVVGTIYGGTSEIQKNIIAKTLGL